MNADIADYLGSYRHRLVQPDLPSPAEYLPLLEEIQENGWYSNFGPLVRRLESQLLTTIGAAGECCVTCCSATSGLSAALLATGRTGPVLLPAFTFPASLGAVRAAGMTPVVADVDAETWTLAGNLLDRALVETGAKAVMLVAPFGIQTDWEAQLAICREHGAAVVIDNASGLGGPRPAKGFGEEVLEVFSMHATKPIGVGEGGVIFAHRMHDAALRSALNFALDSYVSPGGPAWGFNGKMSEFHAAIGIVQLDRIGDIVSRRQAFANIYRERLAHYPEIVCPQDMNCAPWHVFPALLPSVTAVESLIESAAAAGVEIRRYCRPSLSRWPETRRFEACPVAEDLADRMCALPVRAARAGPETNLVAELVLDALDRALTSQ
ncbi:MAG: DegT/DnrJ/EryC1/StrS family aminotransferase [Steroidobacteraceae bacterium]